ncbi:hypothetical protein WL88_25810 [Burkholderia diffusa]|uniref:IclR-ED domain-containing protein n=2 Tax=Burkholderia diffusa TaxID=488732 RepID=A0AAW3PB87_9BURK|nr:hypothetical protein WL86_29845 [Burkholderia diffusa]KWF38686.1 hypothetical protein WL85_10995 [Burkholderia diffusa]KWF46731.1 hypothetical protein WL88_25810 [Burkholderia diffusa]KWF50698.1 hypothetical protein WL87_16110 [Burkholderia diffusa]
MFVGRPYAVDLFATTRVTTALFVQDGSSTVRCVEKIHGPNEPLDTGNPGTCAPMHCTAAGKVILAFSGKATAQLPESLVQYTPRTIGDPAILNKELALIRRDGYGIEGEEWRRGVSAVAVPIVNRYNQVLGALSCGGQSAVSDWTDETMVQVRKIAEIMKDQARRIATAMESTRGS